MTVSWESVLSDIEQCEGCDLCKTRTHVVPGEGNEHAALMFVGEGPGADEDRTGRPFVGRAGQLLDRMIAAMGLTREDVYIANVVKCRDGGTGAHQSRDPHHARARAVDREKRRVLFADLSPCGTSARPREKARGVGRSSKSDEKAGGAS